MTVVVLTALGPLGAALYWAQADPATDLIRSGYAQLGFLALLLAGGWWVIRQSDKRAAASEKAWRELLSEANARTAEERTKREAAEADSRAVRDVFIREVVPTMTLHTARFEQAIEGLERVVGVVERVMTSTMDRTK